MTLDVYVQTTTDGFEAAEITNYQVPRNIHGHLKRMDRCLYMKYEI